MAGRQGAYIFGCAGECLLPDEAAFFADAQPWGFILFARNIRNPEQLRRLTDALRAAVGWNAPIFIDQEGGRVQRMGPPHWQQWLPPLDQVSANPGAAERSMFLRYRLIADELRAVGIDGNCAPCADVATPHTHPVLRNRCYGQDPQTVTRISRAVANALLAGGVLPILKHIPGHGRARLDSHLELPHVTAPRHDLEAVDFAAMQALADLPLGMSAHIVYQDIDPQAPATISPIMTGLIRDQIGFAGLLMSDDISMQALAGDVRQRSRAALAAGLDMILHCNGDLAEMMQIAQQAGHLTKPGQARADAALAMRHSPDPIDKASLQDELDHLLREATHG
ncbi:MAG: beta-hexosaminidase [Rhodobacterales bacterium]|nr:MAG: beta-hexosaminidase [Rhodobacterales bacterium]